MGGLSGPHRECVRPDCVVFGLDLARVAISSVHHGFEKSIHMVLKGK